MRLKSYSESFRFELKPGSKKDKEVNPLAKIIALANQKGGVGKTTTTINLAACLGLAGKKVLLVDFDPQGNATSGCGTDKKEVEKTIYDVLVDGIPVRDIIIHTAYKLDLLPANIDLAGAEIELVAMPERERRLEEALGTVRGQYDYILIDCPPSVGLLTLNALTAADMVLLPIQCEYYALEGVAQLIDTVELVKGVLNERLTIGGVLLTMYDSRTKLSEQVAAEVREHFPKETYNTVIPRTVRLSEAPSYGMPVVFYDKACKGTEVYMKLAKEVISRE